MSVKMLAAAAARASRTRPSSVITPGLLLAGSLDNKLRVKKIFPRCLHRWRGSQCSASGNSCTGSIPHAVQNRMEMCNLRVYWCSI